MVKCGICGGEAPKQPCITEDGKCDLCGKEVMLKEEAEKGKQEKPGQFLFVEHLKKPVRCFQVLIFGLAGRPLNYKFLFRRFSNHGKEH